MESFSTCNHCGVHLLSHMKNEAISSTSGQLVSIERAFEFIFGFGCLLQKPSDQNIVMCLCDDCGDILGQIHPLVELFFQKAALDELVAKLFPQVRTSAAQRSPGTLRRQEAARNLFDEALDSPLSIDSGVLTPGISDVDNPWSAMTQLLDMEEGDSSPAPSTIPPSPPSMTDVDMDPPVTVASGIVLPVPVSLSPSPLIQESLSSQLPEPAHELHLVSQPANVIVAEEEVSAAQPLPIVSCDPSDEMLHDLFEPPPLAVSPIPSISSFEDSPPASPSRSRRASASTPVFTGSTTYTNSKEHVILTIKKKFTKRDEYTVTSNHSNGRLLMTIKKKRRTPRTRTPVTWDVGRMQTRSFTRAILAEAELIAAMPEAPMIQVEQEQPIRIEQEARVETAEPIIVLDEPSSAEMQEPVAIVESQEEEEASRAEIQEPVPILEMLLEAVVEPSRAEIQEPVAIVETQEAEEPSRAEIQEPGFILQILEEPIIQTHEAEEPMFMIHTLEAAEESMFLITLEELEPTVNYEEVIPHVDAPAAGDEVTGVNGTTVDPVIPDADMEEALEPSMPILVDWSQSMAPVLIYTAPPEFAKFESGQTVSTHHLYGKKKQEKAHHGTHECNHWDGCLKVFQFQWTLRRHIQLDHDKLPHSNCSRCGLKFFEPGVDESHFCIPREEQAEALKNTPFRCEYCGRVFKLKTNFMRHLGLHELEMYGPTLSCGYEGCDETFKLPTHLRVHERKHEMKKERAFPCTLCPKRFWTKRNLQSHMNTPHTRKGWKCETCGNGYTHKRYLRRHELQQHGIQAETVKKNKTVGKPKKVSADE